MRVQGSFRYAAPPEVVASLFTDPVALTEATPGLRTLTETAPDQFQAVMRVALGGFSTEYTGTMQITDRRGADGFTILLDATTTNGYARGQCNLLFMPVGDEATEVRYDVDLDVGGAQRLLPPLARGLVDFFLHGMSHVLTSRLRSTRRGLHGKRGNL